MTSTISTVFTAALLAAALALGACGGSSADGSVNYSVSAEDNYQKALAEIEEKDWVAAAKYFSFIKARFPYSKYAVLAELGMADAEFGAKHYLQAVDSFKLFIKFHPTHEKVTNGYASFRIAEAYYRMLPGDWWLLPPSYEKDQTATSDAERELKAFVDKYPNSPYINRAREMLAEVNQRLAEHEWYVARFYWEKDKPMGTVLRLRRLLDRHPGVGYDGDALWLLGKAYERVEMYDRARDAWQRLADQHPKHERAADARRAAERMARKPPPPKPQ